MTSSSPTPSPAPSSMPAGDRRPRRLVVGVDGSVQSIAALERAGAMAAAMGGSVRAVTCWSLPVLLASDEPLPVDLLERGAADAQEEALQAAFGKDRPAFLETAVVQGGTARVLIEESRDADLLVVGSRGHGGFAGLLLGSVSTACAEHAACDVLVVRARPR